MDSLSAECENWSLDSDKKLLNWMEAFSGKLENRFWEVRGRISSLIGQVNALDASLQNTSNHFSSLSSTQFVENRILEEDENVVRSDPADVQSPPVAVTESEIHSRYKRAIITALNSVQSAMEQKPELDRSGRTENRRLPLMHAKGAVVFEGPIRPLPHIIGSSNFAEDATCGLGYIDEHSKGGFRGKAHVGGESSEGNWSTSERHVNEGSRQADLGHGATETKIHQPENDMWQSDRSRRGQVAASDSLGHNGAVIETDGRAVSAVEGFRAMLEAALRGPSELYDESITDGRGLLSEPAIFQEDYYTSNLTSSAESPKVKDAKMAPSRESGFGSPPLPSSTMKLEKREGDDFGDSIEGRVTSRERHVNGKNVAEVVVEKDMETLRKKTTQEQIAQTKDLRALLGLDGMEEEADDSVSGKEVYSEALRIPKTKSRVEEDEVINMLKGQKAIRSSSSALSPDRVDDGLFDDEEPATVREKRRNRMSEEKSLLQWKLPIPPKTSTLKSFMRPSNKMIGGNKLSGGSLFDDDNDDADDAISIKSDNVSEHGQPPPTEGRKNERPSEGVVGRENMEKAVDQSQRKGFVDGSSENGKGDLGNKSSVIGRWDGVKEQLSQLRNKYRDEEGDESQDVGSTKIRPRSSENQDGRGKGNGNILLKKEIHGSGFPGNKDKNSLKGTLFDDFDEDELEKNFNASDRAENLFRNRPEVDKSMSGITHETVSEGRLTQNMNGSGLERGKNLSGRSGPLFDSSNTITNTGKSVRSRGLFDDSDDDEGYEEEVSGANNFVPHSVVGEIGRESQRTNNKDGANESRVGLENNVSLSFSHQENDSTELPGVSPSTRLGLLAAVASRKPVIEDSDSEDDFEETKSDREEIRTPKTLPQVQQRSPVIFGKVPQKGGLETGTGIGDIGSGNLVGGEKIKSNNGQSGVQTLEAKLKEEVTLEDQKSSATLFHGLGDALKKKTGGRGLFDSDSDESENEGWAESSQNRSFVSTLSDREGEGKEQVVSANEEFRFQKDGSYEKNVREDFSESKNFNGSRFTGNVDSLLDPQKEKRDFQHGNTEGSFMLGKDVNDFRGERGLRNNSSGSKEDSLSTESRLAIREDRSQNKDVKLGKSGFDWSGRTEKPTIEKRFQSLFGEDDDENEEEDSLFGPLVGKR